MEGFKIEKIINIGKKALPIYKTILAHEILSNNVSTLNKCRTINKHNKLSPLNIESNNKDTLLMSTFLSWTSFLYE